MKYPIQTGNIILILVGVVLVLSGPYIIYRTIKAVKTIRRLTPNESIQPFNNGLNIVIALLFSFAGIYFIVNNLRGNPLAP